MRRHAAQPAILLLALLSVPSKGSTPNVEPVVAVSGETTTKRWDMPSFKVEAIEWTNSGTPLLHAPNHSLHVNLTWQHDKTKVSLQDNGLWISLQMDLQLGPDGKNCVATYEPIGAFGSIPSNDKFWRWASDFVPKKLLECGGSPDQAEWIRKKMLAATKDYPRSADAWKGQSFGLFKTGSRRCVNLENRYMPGPSKFCSKFSD